MYKIVRFIIIESELTTPTEHATIQKHLPRWILKLY
jgi:hypothetical protein